VRDGETDGTVHSTKFSNSFETKGIQDEG